eukprot:TRINITY_DN3531_c1_g1_i1.p1 TRINITY_DN3531_c1_g1~~TRINITY_DN3531_c1_g1_i1.p1  ORF type:complete len:326 (+),score=133.11 TRINITY_DN3531_c1_g1_i1:80-979(+)
MRHAALAAAAALALPCAALGTNDFGRKFLEENKKQAGVVTLPSGLQYKVLREGYGLQHPLPGTSCECHYEGRTAQEYSKQPKKGKKFDSSYDRGSPTSFSPNGVIPGWTEAMQLMVEGDKWELFIPSELGYGDKGQPPDIGGGDVLVFTMELLRIDGESKPAFRGPPPYAEVETKEQLDGWAQAKAMGEGLPLVLGLFRQPSVGKLYDAYRGAAHGLTKKNVAAFAFSDQSRYDPETRQYTKSPLETALKIRAPGVYTSGDKGYSWTKCKTPHQQRTATVQQVKETIEDCIKALGRDEL